jgi:hypothetical protein
MFGTPASAMVGACGNAGQRWSAVTASGTSLPSLMPAMAPATGGNQKAASPLATAALASITVLWLTLAAWAPLCRELLGDEIIRGRPSDANLYCPGWAFASSPSARPPTLATTVTGWPHCSASFFGDRPRYQIGGVARRIGHHQLHRTAGRAAPDADASRHASHRRHTEYQCTA